MASTLSLSASGLRGRVGEGLGPPAVHRYAAALGTYVDGEPVVLGRDTRRSAPMLAQAAAAALRSCGCRVWDVGVAPAAFVQYLTGKLGAGGLLVTGAHHPGGWMALLPLGRSGACASPIEGQNLIELYHAQRFRQLRYGGIGGVSPVPPEWEEKYLDQLCARLDTAGIAKAKLTVVADFCNGAGSNLGKRFADRLGLKLIAINDREDGVLPHDPEPRPRASVQVQALMGPLGADAGFVFSSDLERLAIVTDDGETLSEEYTYPLIADHFLARRGALTEPVNVVANLSTTRTLEHVVSAHGANLVKSAVGAPAVLDRMYDTHAVLAGEGCGSIALGADYPYYDGLLMMGLFLEALALNGHTARQRVDRLLRYAIVKRQISCPVVAAYSLVNRLRQLYPDLEPDDTDGLRFDWPEGWVHLRVSQTERSLRLIAEWPDMETARRKAGEVQAGLERMVAE